ncbi:methyltransferase [Peribacillus frigoritolerans]|uniref:methyltransferase n=1 Tax=Peribacillus TaxID=2675229 RepID=UPI002E1E9A7C|nr:methyltransferase [Peribacillus frigoritolerans]MED3994628.1 methyltransferase [Peribacillus frigoritolerans]
MNNTLEKEKLNPTEIHKLITGFISSKAIFMGIDFGLFTLLDNNARSIEAIAHDLKLQLRPTRILVQSCKGIGLLQENDGLIQNTPLASAFLVEGKQGYMGNLAKHQESHYNNFVKLNDALKNNSSITGRVKKDGYANEGAGANEERQGTRTFIKAMHASSVVQAKSLVNNSSIKGSHLLDIGCGSAAYSIEYAKQNPHIKITAIDYEATCEVAKEFVREQGLQSQIDFIEGNIFNINLPEEVDTVLLSHVLDGYGQDKAFEILKKIHGLLPKGGKLIMHAHLPERAETTFPYLFNLILLANTEEGEVHGEQTILNWIEQLGFEDIKLKKVSPISSVIEMYKKGEELC